MLLPPMSKISSLTLVGKDATIIPRPPAQNKPGFWKFEVLRVFGAGVVGEITARNACFLLTGIGGSTLFIQKAVKVLGSLKIQSRLDIVQLFMQSGVVDHAHRILD